MDIILKSALLGTLAALTVSFMDYPNAYWVLALLSALSVYVSYTELNHRVDVKGYLMKIRNKFRR